jgi:hypothetical protein
MKQLEKLDFSRCPHTKNPIIVSYVNGAIAAALSVDLKGFVQRLRCGLQW